MKKLLCCCFILIFCLAFSSVNASDTFYDTRGTKYEGVVERLSRLGIINGISENTFAPNKSVTRAELAKIIVQMRGMGSYAVEDIKYKKVFSDVKQSDWYYKYVIVASDLELINGYEDGTFRPNQEVSYAEAIALFIRSLGYNISEDNPEGWYVNYLKKMREIELNYHVGEVNYKMPAKRGDIAIYAWNTLASDRWVITSENTETGFTYSYSSKSQLDTFFSGYYAMNKRVVVALSGTEFWDDDYLKGDEGLVKIWSEDKDYRFINRDNYTYEKVPLYVLGGTITGLELSTGEIVGLTIDEDYEDVTIVKGPVFYLKEQGYELNKAQKVVSFGEKENASYAYLVIENETNNIRRAVYVDASETISVETINIEIHNNSGDDEEEEKDKVILNEEELIKEDTVLYKDGLPMDWKDVNEGDIVTHLGNGFYIYSNQKIEGVLSEFGEDEESIFLNKDEYIVNDNCICYLYNEEDPIKYELISTKKLKEHVGTEVTVILNVAEEICVINFGKTQADEEKYKFGFVTEVRYSSEEKMQRVKINYGDELSRYKEIEVTETDYLAKGDLVAIGEGLEGKGYQKILKDCSFDNEISVKYQYDAKEIDYPRIGEYIVNDETEYYKVTLKYEDNSVEDIESVEVSKLDLEKDISDLTAYELYLIYNEDMEVVKVFAINEINKFENQIALVKDIKLEKDKDNEFLKLTLSVTNSAVKGYEISNNNNEIKSGDILTFIYEDEDNEKIAIDEIFRKESIGYKRDLIVKEFDSVSKEIVFENGNKMNLLNDVYEWNGSKINLNKYRFIIAEVSNDIEKWKFKSLEMFDKEDVSVLPNDRIAIGELQDVIVIYRGYKE